MLKNIVEAILLSSSEPLTCEKMLRVFDDWQKPTLKQIQQIVDELALDYTQHVLELKCLASGYCFQIKEKYAPWISRLLIEKPAKYSNALLETLAIIAYRQPVTRAEIEEIRGVSVSSSILKTLLEREWIRITGYKDLPGKPAVYGTTHAFLDYFNLASIEDLPSLSVVNHE